MLFIEFTTGQAIFSNKIIIYSPVKMCGSGWSQYFFKKGAEIVKPPFKGQCGNTLVIFKGGQIDEEFWQWLFMKGHHN